MTPRAPSKQRLARVSATLQAIEAAVPEPRCELDFSSPFELLVATILSAQTTDKTVNLVTPGLFAKYPDAEALAGAALSEVEALIKPTGFYKNKARNIVATAGRLVALHGGAVPESMAELVALPGVARKTANVVLGTGFGIASGITVDTHVLRVSKRLGFTRHTDPVKVEADLMRVIAPARWIATGHRLVLFGRYTCLARKPRCVGCACADLCPARRKLVGG